jgi:LCP family protein required for cell wall assembly
VSRWGPGRRPDPAREGTVYRSHPKLGVRLPGRNRSAGGGGVGGGLALAGDEEPPADPPVRTPAPAPAAGRRRPGRWVAVVVVLLLVYPLALFAAAWTALNRVDALPGAGGPADTPGRTFLVVGSDSRQDLSAAERKRLGTGSTAGQRTDTIMLLHVPSGGGPTVLVSVPRDSYVPIPGRARNKINAAYAVGGPRLLVRTVEQVSGLHVDEYVETGLGGFAGLVDAIGGVQMCPKRALKDAKAHIDIQAGCQDFDGSTALGYARARYSDPRGDLGRVDRQRQVLAAIAGKTLSPSVLAPPWRAFPAARAGGDALTVDSGTTPLGLARFVLAMRAVAGGNGLSLTVPVATTQLQTGAGIAVGWDRERARQLFDAIRDDDTEAIRPIAKQQAKLAPG